MVCRCFVARKEDLTGMTRKPPLRTVSLVPEKREKAWDEGWGLSVGEQGGRKGTGRKPTEPPSPNRIFGKTSVGEGHYKTRTQMVRERGNQKYDKTDSTPLFPK